MDLTKIVSLLVSLLISMWPTLISCNEEELEAVVTEALTEAIAEAQSGDAFIVKSGESDYTICVANDAEAYVADAANELSASIFKKTLAYVPVTDKIGDHAIFINYSGEGHSADIGKYGYSITEKDGCVYIDAASEEALYCALILFDDTYIKPSQDRSITVPDGTSTVKKYDEKLILADYIDMGVEVEAEIVPVTSVKPFSISGKTYNISQGVASDGEYIYVAIKHSEALGVIVKLDFNGKVIAKTEPYEFGHANDMTYDTDKDLIVVVHGTSYTYDVNGNGTGRRFSLVDPETMKVIYTDHEGFDLGKEAGAISYNTETGVYTIGRLCTYYHQFKMNDDYTLDYYFSTTRSSAEEEGRVGYVGQGLGGDNRYVYFPYSHGATDNLLVAYDNSGNYVTTISYPCTMESESLFFVNGRYYINYNYNGSTICELVYKPIYTAQTADFDEIDELMIAVYDGVTVYADASDKSLTVKTISKGDSIRAIGFSEDGNWYKIRLPYGGYGYIESGLVMPAQYSTLTPYSIDTKVKVGTAEVYRVPNSTSTDNNHVLFTLEKGTAVTVTGKLDGTSWVRISANGKSGFMLAIKLESIDWSKYVENADN